MNGREHMDNTKSPSTAMETAFTCSHTLWSSPVYGGARRIHRSPCGLLALPLSHSLQLRTEYRNRQRNPRKAFKLLTETSCTYFAQADLHFLLRRRKIRAAPMPQGRASFAPALGRTKRARLARRCRARHPFPPKAAMKKGVMQSYNKTTT